MTVNLDEIIHHTADENCVACRAQEIAEGVLVPAVEAWEASHGLPRLSLAIHGAAILLRTLLEEQIERVEIEHALSDLLDDIEREIEQNKMLGGPPQGSA